MQFLIQQEQKSTSKLNKLEEVLGEIASRDFFTVEMEPRQLHSQQLQRCQLICLHLLCQILIQLIMQKRELQENLCIRKLHITEAK